jgi:RNA polymerase sigma-70 factor (ECF subfamily)
MKFVDGEDGFDFSRYDSEDEEYKETIPMEDIQKLLPQLPNSQRKVIELYYIDGLKHDEIAEKLGITASTSKTNLMKAKAKLKNLLPKNIYK